MDKIFETHAHYDDKQFDSDRDDLIQRFPDNGIDRVVNVGASLDSVFTSIGLAEKYDYIYAAAGVHPSESAELSEEGMTWLRAQTSHPKVVAVGEIGLDYYWDEPARPIQKHWFERQIELAREVKKPVIIHSRDAAKDTLDMMKALHCEDIGGVIHCFSYSVEMAREFLNMGFYLGVGGVVTFKNAKTLKEVTTYAPMERIVLETDSPYLAPVPFRGKRNSALYLPYIAEAVAQLKQVSKKEVIEATSQNAYKLYRMEPFSKCMAQ